MTLTLIFRLAAGFVLAATAANAATYSHYRFTPTRLRGGATTVQLAELTFYSESGPILPTPWVTNPGGDNPRNEGPRNLVDFDPNTKWLDFDSQPVVFEFETPQAIDYYGFTTANDVPDRDPVRWYLEGSNNGSDWDLLDDRSESDYELPLDRFTSYEFTLNGIQQLPIIGFSAAADGLKSSKGLNLAPGDSATLTWQVEGADSVTLTQGETVLAEGGSGSLGVSPEATQDYLVTATNDVGTTMAAITLHVGASVSPPLITELVAKAEETDRALLDEDHMPSDWIEIHNPNPYAISLNGFGLTDKAALSSTIWSFPAGSHLEAEGYIVVFASGKNRAVAGQELHTHFSLAQAGEYLALTGPSGAVADSFAPTYPAQFDDVSYGVIPSGGFGFFIQPTPGEENTTPPGAPGAPVAFVTPPGTFTGSMEVKLGTNSPGADIRYTLDGKVPTESSTLYSGPIPLSATTQIKARTFEAGRAPGEVASEAFLKLSTDLAGRTSDLPVVVLENFAAGSVPSDQRLQPAFFSLFEPDATSGRTSLEAAPTVADRMGFKRRGSSTLGDPKGSYRLEFWQDGSEQDKDVNLLGMSSHDEWVLYAPYSFDRALVRNAFLFELSNAVGTYAPRTRFCEVYLNTDGGELTAEDYQGVYVLMERISRDGERVDVEKLEPSDVAEPEVSGGYILSIDRPDQEDQGFRSAMGHPWHPQNASPQPYYNYVYPKEQNITPEQSSYIRGYIDDLEAALYGSDFKDPEIGYRAWLDVARSIDHHLMVVFSKDPDGLRLSTYLHKPRGGKLAFGPLWDFDRAMGADNDSRSADPKGWSPPYESAEYFEYDYWGRLFEDPDFMQQWIDRWQELRRGEFGDPNLQARVDAMAAELEESHPRNTQRWREVAPNGGPLSSLGGYAGEIDHLKNWLVQRAAWIDSQFATPPYVEAGGAVAPGHRVVLQAAEGTLFYTLDGSDPRLPGGDISPAATAYQGNEIILNSTATLTARSYVDGAWSGPVASRFITGTPAGVESLVVSEIMYHPANPDAAEQAAGITNDGAFEFIELQNVSDGPIELTGVAIRDAFHFDFDGGVLGPGQVVLVVRHRAAFELRYGNELPVAGEWGDPTAADGGASLSNSGERLSILAEDGSVIRDFAYSDAGGWPVSPDGGGPSLRLAQPFSLPDHADPQQWRASGSAGGDPGVGGSVYGSWAEGHFSPAELADAAISGAQADPDGDSLSNLVELAFGSDPRVRSFEALPMAALVEFGDEGEVEDYLTITFTRRLAPSGYILRPQFGSDLESWSNQATVVAAIDNGDGTETVTYRDSVPATARHRFARVEVVGEY